MRNPFYDFGPDRYVRQKGAAESSMRNRERILDRLMNGYRRLIDEEAQNLLWPVEHERILRAYTASMERIADFIPEAGDIEEFCALLDGDESSLWVPGPAGVFLSALVNASSETKLELRLKDYGRRFHFLGYLLPEGKTLELNGDAGDFCGAALDGGRLVVGGSTGDWCGAGMLRGTVLIRGDSGEHTGIWMQGGIIHVDGPIRGMGEPRFGGEIRTGEPDSSEEGAGATSSC